jgi:hypothetical protein
MTSFCPGLWISMLSVCIFPQQCAILNMLSSDSKWRFQHWPWRTHKKPERKPNISDRDVSCVVWQRLNVTLIKVPLANCGTIMLSK